MVDHNRVRPLLFPRSVAVVGASPRHGRIVEEVVRSGIPAWGVHPTRDEALGLPCFPNVADVPDEPELAALLVGHTRAEAAFEDVLAAGMRAFVIPGLGAEAGAEGRGRRAHRGAREPRTRSSARTAWASRRRAGSRSGSEPCRPEAFVPGHVACVAHSGSIAEAFLATGPRVGFRTVVSAGGELSRDVADFVAFLADDDGTARSACSSRLRRPAEFAAALALRRGGQAGRVPQGGALAGRGAGGARPLGRGGRVGARLLGAAAPSRRARGERLPRVPRDARGARPAALAARAPHRGVSESGGECGLLADQGEEAGIPFEPFGDEVARRSQRVPELHAPENPLDCWAIDDGGWSFPGLALLRDTGDYDVLLAQVDLSRHRGEDEQEWCSLIVESLAESTSGTEIFPVVTSVHATDPPPAIAALARERDVALLRGTREALRAVARRQRAPASATGTPAEPAIAAARRRAARARLRALLERYGVTFPPRARAPARSRRLRHSTLGGPVVVKVDGPAHKAAAGGVALGVGSGGRAAMPPSGWAGGCSWHARPLGAPRCSAA